MTRRVLFYVQHLLGIGHVKRAAALTRALTAHGAKVTVAMGGFPVPLADFGSAEILQLPPARTADLSFKTMLDDQDRPVTPLWWDARRAALLKLAAATQPHVVLIEHFPFGRRVFRTELEPMLDSLAATTRIVCSVRDVLVAKDNPEKNRKITDMVLARFDLVLVHGDENVIPFEATFPLADQFQDRIAYSGYISDETVPMQAGPQVPPEGAGDDTAGRRAIVVSTGGGAVGEALLRAALDAARQPVPDRVHWRLLAGDNLPQGIFDQLRRSAPDHVTVERARPDFKALLTRADLSISQGGYNTVMDVISAGCRNLIVPFSEQGESEQATRAVCFARRGLINLFPDGPLNGAKLAEIAAGVLVQPLPPGAAGLNMNGAQRSAELICQLADETL